MGNLLSETGYTGLYFSSGDSTICLSNNETQNMAYPIRDLLLDEETKLLVDTELIDERLNFSGEGWKFIKRELFLSYKKDLIEEARRITEEKSKK